MGTKFPTYYMDDAVFRLESVIDHAMEDLSDVDFDTIVGTGFSGGIVIPSLALMMGKKFALIRKDTDDSHHGPGLLVGEIGDRWIFVDDFIASGKTRKRVMNKVDDFLDAWEGTSEMVGQYMYADRDVYGGVFEYYRCDWKH